MAFLCEKGLVILMNSICAITATSSEVSRKIIFFDQQGIITSVVNYDHNRDANKKFDYYYNDDCLLFAGMGDIHIHAREDISRKNIYKEDFQSASLAAINGGVTFVADMPNNPVPPIDHESYFQKLELSSKMSIPFLMYAGIGPNTQPLKLEVPYKAFMGPSIGDLFFKDNAVLEATIKRYEHQWVSFHCEDPDTLENHKSEIDHFSKRPVKAEILATDFALYLIEKYHLKGKLCHYSSGEGLDKIIAAKKRGVKVTAEITPQHLFFTEESIKTNFKNDETLFQMNPPIRTEADRAKLLWALKAGYIDFIATDHAPHSKAEKENGMSGMPGLDTYALFATWLLIDQKIDPKMVALVTVENPGNFFNHFLKNLNTVFQPYQKWGEGLGFINPGYSASFTILNLKRPHLFTNNQMKSKAHWSPFHQHEFKGSLEGVFIAGTLM